MPIFWVIILYNIFLSEYERRIMGSEFAIVYDVIVAAVLLGMLFAGFAKGFTKSILEIAAVFIAFICAITLSEPSANAIYDNFVDKPVREQIAEVTGGADDSFMKLSPFASAKLDFEAVKINGTPVTEIVPDYEGTGKAVFDLTNVDLSKTGLSEMDLSLLGIKSTDDLSSVNARAADFSMSDIETYGLGKLVTAQYLATTAMQRDMAGTLGKVISTISGYLPSSVACENSESLTVSAVRTVLVSMMDLGASAENALVEGIIKPRCVVFLRTILFAVIFALASVLLGIVIKLSGAVNKIPVIGKLNALAGGILGLGEGVLVVFIVCLAVRFIISLAGKDAVFFNESTIEQTFLFRHIYNFNFLNFLT